MGNVQYNQLNTIPNTNTPYTTPNDTRNNNAHNKQGYAVHNKQHTTCNTQ